MKLCNAVYRDFSQKGRNLLHCCRKDFGHAGDHLCAICIVDFHLSDDSFLRPRAFIWENDSEQKAVAA